MMSTEQQESSTPEQGLQKQTPPAIKITAKARHFKAMFNAVSALDAKEISLKLTPQGVKGSSLTQDKGSLIMLDYPKIAFDDYDVNTEVKIGLRPDELATIFGRAKKDESPATLGLDFENSKLSFSFDGKTFKDRLIDASSSDLPDLKYVSGATIETAHSQWMEIVEDMFLGEKSSFSMPTFTAYVDGGKVKFARSNSEKLSYDCVRGDPIPKDGEKQLPDAWAVFGNGEGEYGLEKIHAVCKSVKADRVILELGQKIPMRIRFDEGYVTMFQAPIKEREEKK